VHSIQETFLAQMDSASRCESGEPSLIPGVRFGCMALFFQLDVAHTDVRSKWLDGVNSLFENLQQHLETID
jgi:hypothetical protein